MADLVYKALETLGVKFGLEGRLQRKVWWGQLHAALISVRQLSTQIASILREFSALLRST